MTKQIPIYQVDAFTNKTFGGNPAAVCPLEEWLPDETLQAIAAENNLSETAFFVREGESYHLRWFTPTTEVDLCGHATLASAFVIFEHVEPKATQITFTGRSGELVVQKTPDGMRMDFPAWAYEKADIPEAVIAALGATPEEFYTSDDMVAVFSSAAQVQALNPDMHQLIKIKTRGVIATAPGEGDVDFVSRWFGPQVGVDEDPVTGSAHCVLTPLWAEKLGKTELNAHQISQRSGELRCALKQDRVELTGNAVLYMQGNIYV